MSSFPFQTGANGGRSGLEGLQKLKAEVHRQLLESLNLIEAQRLPSAQLYQECLRRVDSLLDQQRTPLSGPEKRALVQEVMDEVFGLGPIEDLLKDPMISDILVNNANSVYIERAGRLERVNVSFRDNAHVLQVIQRIAARVGRRIDESSPMLDARLADGSRVNAIVPPLALKGPALSIRRFGTIPIDMQKLMEFESLTPEMGEFLEACVRCKCNLVVSGGTGTGKTTLLNALSRWIPSDERLITLEDAAELQLQQEHVVQLETRPANIEGQGEVTQRDLLRNSLRMRPDRIIVGEVRGGETLDMLQAMNTGHEGSMTTVHANSPRDAIRRLENMVSMAGLNYPVAVIREQLASALDLVVHLERVTGGRRKVVDVCEINGMEGTAVCMQDLFRFVQTGVDSQGHAEGSFEVCGVRPQLLPRLEAFGVKFPTDTFRRRKMATYKQT